MINYYSNEGGDFVPNVEKRILQWMEKHLMLLAFAAFSGIGLLLRLYLIDFVSGDSTYFLLPWYEQIRQNGLSQQVGNYNFLYQLLIWVMTKLPVEPLHGYKILSVVFDYLLALAAAAVTVRLVKEDKLWKGVAAYAAVLLCPTVFLNSAAWAQCDSIFVFFAVAAVACLLRELYRPAMILLGFAFSFKLQAVFLLPLMLFVYFRKQKFSLLSFLWIPGVMCITSLPAVLFGRNVLEIFAVYAGQSETYPYLAMNYPSVWMLLAQPLNSQHYALLKSPAILFTVCVLAILMLVWIRKKLQPYGRNLLYMAFLLCYSCVLFLPAMHERYGYLYEILAIAIACVSPGTVPLCAGLLGVSMCTYGAYLFKIETIPMVWLTVINLAVYLFYVVTLNRSMGSDEA
jgi:Gpi18-like mannosyltransferase